MGLASEVQRCFDFAQNDNTDWFTNDSSRRPERAVLDQTALSEITEIAAGRAFHEIDSEFEQTNFPRVINALNDCAERLVLAFDVAFGALDHGID